MSLGWKLLNLERYDETIDLDEHLDVFLTWANLSENHSKSSIKENVLLS